MVTLPNGYVKYLRVVPSSAEDPNSSCGVAARAARFSTFFGHKFYGSDKVTSVYRRWETYLHQILGEHTSLIDALTILSYMPGTLTSFGTGVPHPKLSHISTYLTSCKNWGRGGRNV